MRMTKLYSNAVLWLLKRDWTKDQKWNEADYELRNTRLAELRVKLKEEVILDEENKRKRARELTSKDIESKLIR